MDDSMHHSGWDASDNTKPIDAQAFNSDFDFWDPMCLFSEPQPSTNASIDSIVAAPQDFQNIATSNQELSYNLDNEITSPDHLIPKSYALPIDDKKRDIQKEAREFQDMLQDVQREIVSIRDQVQKAHAELCTIQSNHAKLLLWTLDMGETMKALLKWLGEQTGMEAVGQQGFRVEDLASWLNPGSEG